MKAKFLQKKAATPSSQYPPTLEGGEAIAAYIASVAPDYVDEEFIAEYFGKYCTAQLKQIPIAHVAEGHPDVNKPSPSKEKRYQKMDPSTLPPIVVMGGQVVDGNHRLRAAKVQGLTTIWAYVVEDGDES